MLPPPIAVLTVGATEIDGLMVGTAVGGTLAVGWGVGGVYEGVFVGKVEGAIDMLGVPLGLLDGLNVGDAEGLDDGDVVGNEEGLDDTLGLLDGLAEGVKVHNL